MNFERSMILAGAILCTISCAISIVGGVVVVGCFKLGACADPGYDAAHAFAPLAWWSIPMFGAGAVIGFRAVWRYLKFPKISFFAKQK